jgi:DNA-binding transcriptional ArsR family regulator
MSTHQFEEEAMALASERSSVTVEEASKKLKISWPRTHSILSKLTGEGKLIHERKGRVNLYRLRKEAKAGGAATTITDHIVKYPSSLVKPKDLDKLSKEIKDFWSKNKSAQDIVEGERHSV